ncbi:GNAT family N-acetyltransferase [Geobacter sp. DSM 9736]|uniref:GNAT family N-acetyltransferase n=1 Tax=Geobacter sp. DSM 9736 TaxID=1277350 RepID=UPI000B50579D|nr:GNAT family N-acetyltransferase [Geobacter sp. DSM 9736]SNB46037.1 hypothetical protein SAMN06269301_1475 [Geobacter sp. DSM 9736]
MKELDQSGISLVGGDGLPVAEEVKRPEVGIIRSCSARVGEAANILQSLGPLGAVRLMSGLLFSLNHYFVMGRSLAAPVAYPSHKKPSLTFLPLREEDIPNLRKQVEALPSRERRELLSRLYFRSCGFSNCYAMKAGEEVVYLQWIIFPEENSVIKSRFARKFYPLSERQVMVENVYTFPHYRGRGLLPFGTLQLLEIAKEKGFSSAICYIRNDNITSLNEFYKMGFKIVKIIREYKVLGKVWRTL